MKKEEIEQIVDSAVLKTLSGVGLTVDKPVEIQKDFIHLRNHRTGCEATKRNMIKAIITVLIPSTLFLLWEAIKAMVKTN